jgi:serine/threonine-protein kinase RsbT
MHFEFNIEGGNFTRAGLASSEIKKMLKQLNVDLGIIKRTVVAAYEAEVNVVAHAYSGTAYVDLDEEKIVIRFVDEGPGIPDIEMAMKEGFSTASSTVREMGFGAGMGLPNMKKNADDLKIASEVGKGTEVQITMFFKRDL